MLKKKIANEHTNYVDDFVSYISLFSSKNYIKLFIFLALLIESLT
jgi:hypothetical protein